MNAERPLSASSPAVTVRCSRAAVAGVGRLLRRGCRGADESDARRQGRQAGYLTHVAENVFTLDGQRIALAPGGIIRGSNNLILTPNAVPRESLASTPRTRRATCPVRGCSRRTRPRRPTSAGASRGRRRPRPAHRSARSCRTRRAAAAWRRTGIHEHRSEHVRRDVLRHHAVTRPPSRRPRHAATRVHPHLRVPDERVRLGQDGRRARARPRASSRPTQPEDADLILFNTCSVREKAQEKVFADLGRVKHLKRARPDLHDRRRRLRGEPGRRGHRRARALRRRGVRPADAAPPAAAARRARRAPAPPQVDISFPEIEKFDHLPPARVEGAARLRLDHGGLQQVLQLLRRAVHARRGSVAAVRRRARPRSRSSPSRA